MALRELSALFGSVLRREVALQVAEVIRERDLVPRPVPGEPTSAELARAVLAAIEDASARGRGSYVGAHKVVLDALRSEGVQGLELYRTLRRTEKQVAADPGPSGREGGARFRIDDPTWPIDDLARAKVKRQRRGGGAGASAAAGAAPTSEARV